MTTRTRSVAFVAVLCAGVLIAGCRLDRSPLYGMGRVTPQQYCPGDTVTASYDLLMEETCPADVDCAAHFPTLTITSAPESFPPRTVRAYADSFTFSPTADNVGVTFDIDRDAVTIPTSRFDGSTRIFVQRTNLRDYTHNISRIAGTIDSELLHEGVCAGNTPVNLPADLPGPPRLSPNMRLVELCNTNGIAVTIELVRVGGSFTATLPPGRCLVPGADGVPADVGDVRTIGANAPDLAARCSATMQQPPRPLRTVARLACR